MDSLTLNCISRSYVSVFKFGGLIIKWNGWMENWTPVKSPSLEWLSIECNVIFFFQRISIGTYLRGRPGSRAVHHSGPRLLCGPRSHVCTPPAGAPRTPRPSGIRTGSCTRTALRVTSIILHSLLFCDLLSWSKIKKKLWGYEMTQ